MAEPTTADLKLVQYLNEAYGKEKELETALQAHIRMTTRDTYKKRLQQHLKETKDQAKGLERRIKALGGKADKSSIPDAVPGAAADMAEAAMTVANKAVSAAKGPVHMLRGTGEAEKLLKNAKTELWNEFEEIGNYLAIEELANTVGDKETAKLAKEFRRQEERMAGFLQKLIPQLTKQVAKEEIPAGERRADGGSRTTSRSRSRSASSSNGSTASKRSGSAASSGRSTSRSASSRSKSGSASSKSGSASSKSGSASSKSGSSSRSRTASASSKRSSSTTAKSNGKSSGSASRSGGSSRKKSTSSS